MIWNSCLGVKPKLTNRGRLLRINKLSDLTMETSGEAETSRTLADNGDIKMISTTAACRRCSV